MKESIKDFMPKLTFWAIIIMVVCIIIMVIELFIGHNTELRLKNNYSELEEKYDQMKESYVILKDDYTALEEKYDQMIKFYEDEPNLEVCPICKSEVRLVVMDYLPDKYYYIRCDECGLETGKCKYRENLIEYWNNR